MDKIDTGTFTQVEHYQFVVFFNSDALPSQTFIVEDGATIVDYPLNTEGTPAYKRITHTNGSVEDVYMHHVAFSRWVKVSRKVRVSVKVDDTPARQTP